MLDRMCLAFLLASCRSDISTYMTNSVARRVIEHYLEAVYFDGLLVLYSHCFSGHLVISTTDNMDVRIKLLHLDVSTGVVIMLVSRNDCVGWCSNTHCLQELLGLLWFPHIKEDAAL